MNRTFSQHVHLSAKNRTTFSGHVFNYDIQKLLCYFGKCKWNVVNVIICCHVIDIIYNTCNTCWLRTEPRLCNVIKSCANVSLTSFIVLRIAALLIADCLLLDSLHGWQGILTTGHIAVSQRHTEDFQTDYAGMRKIQSGRQAFVPSGIFTHCLEHFLLQSSKQQMCSKIVMETFIYRYIFTVNYASG